MDLYTIIVKFRQCFYINIQSQIATLLVEWLEDTNLSV